MVRTTRSSANLLDALERREFNELLGTDEDGFVEAKGVPCQIGAADKSKQDFAKHELAKDVSALANVHGGVILIGFQTGIDPMAAGEFIESCRSFERSLVNVDQYAKLLEDWICPPVPGLAIRWFPSSEDSGRGVIAIVVPPEATTGKPYLVTRTVDSGGRVNGTLFGFFERLGDHATPTSVEMLRGQLRAGIHLQPLHDRLEVVEDTLGTITAAVAS